MGWLSRVRPTIGQPRQLELWGELVRNFKFARRALAMCLVLAFAGLALGAYGLEVGITRPLAFHVDASGRAALAGRLEERRLPSEIEVRYVAKQFIRHYMAPNSLTIEADLADAWNLMSEELRRDNDQMLEQFKKQHGEALVAFVKKQGIETVLAIDNAKTEVYASGDKFYRVHLQGTARTWPLNRVGQDSEFVEHPFQANLVLVRVPRTEQTPNGLLVAKVTRRFTSAQAKEINIGPTLEK